MAARIGQCGGGGGLGGPARQVLLGHAAQRRDPVVVVVQAGDVVKLLAARVQEGLAHFHVDFFQRLQAVAGEAGAHHVHPPRARLAQRLDGGLGVGLQPLGLAKARLEGDAVALLAQAQALGQQAAGFAGLAVVGVAQVQGALGHAMKAHHQLVGLAVVLPVRFDGAGQGVDVAGGVVVVVHEPQLGHVAGGGGPGVDGVKHAGRGGGRILRVQRQDEDARGALGLQRIELAGDGRVAVAHGVAHQHRVACLAQPAAQQRGLLGRPVRQGRALGRPDAGVFGGRLGRARAQDDAVQDGHPQQLGDLHHAVVTQKLRQIAAHGRGRGFVGRAQVAQQHSGAVGLAVGERGFGVEGRHAAFSPTRRASAGWEPICRLAHHR